MSLLTSFTNPGPGGSQPTIYAPFDGRTINAGSGAGAITANAIYLLRGRLDVAKRLTDIDYDVYTTTAGNVDAGWYVISGTNLVRQDHSGPIAIGGVSRTVQTLTQLLGLVVPAGLDFWLALGSDAAVTIAREVGLAEVNAIGRDSISIASVYSSGLPATIALASTAGTAVIPWLAAHLA